MQQATATTGQLSDLFAQARLTPVQRRIAAHIVQRGPQAAFCSSIELAEQVGVSQPSVTRLATALGYAGFSDLQRAIRALVLEERAPSRAPADAENKLQHAVGHAIDALAVLRRQLADPDALEHAAQALAQTPVLPVHGSRSAAPLAAQFEFFAAKIHPDVRLLTGSRTELLDGLERAAAGGATALLALALPRYPRELAELLEAARERDIEVVLLTDSPLSPLAALATSTLWAPVSSDLVFDAAVAPLQLVTVLLEVLADARPARTRERLERFDAWADAHDYFTPA
ncbi:MAG: MurR/RpiR family transcriptional regulator [Actinomycetota bacterium]|nr:MurR/RpiR family transcriptional regulator [Actinomycetota bacterium]